MSNIVKYDPFEELNALQRQFFGDDLFVPDTTSNIPTTDVYEQGNNLVVEAHLPNFDRKDVDIQVNGNNLVISAERHEKEEDKGKKYVIRESSNSFYRSISLPTRAKKEDIKADLVNGKLIITIPMAQLPDSRKIEIGDGKGNKQLKQLIFIKVNKAGRNDQPYKVLGAEASIECDYLRTAMFDIFLLTIASFCA